MPVDDEDEEFEGFSEENSSESDAEMSSGE